MSSSVAEAVTKERLHSSGEDYLKAIFILEAQHGSVRSVEVAEYMNVSKASVIQAKRSGNAGDLASRKHQPKSQQCVILKHHESGDEDRRLQNAVRHRPMICLHHWMKPSV